MNPLVLRFMRIGTRLCRDRGLDEQLIDLETFYDFGISWHENKRLLTRRIESLARRFGTSECHEIMERYRHFYGEPSNNPNSLWRFLQGQSTALVDNEQL